MALVLEYESALQRVEGWREGTTPPAITRSVRERYIAEGEAEERQCWIRFSPDGAELRRLVLPDGLQPLRDPLNGGGCGGEPGWTWWLSPRSERAGNFRPGCG